MDKLNMLVTEHLTTELLQPDRLRETLASLWTGRAAKLAEVDGRVTTLREEVTSAQDKLRRLYQLVEDGVTDLDDMLKDRIATIKADRDRAQAALDRMHVMTRPPAIIQPEVVERFGDLMRLNLTDGTIPFRKAWLQSIVDRIEVGEETVRIIGDKANLEQLLAAGQSPTGELAGVRSSVRKWRSHGESNPSFRRERATS